MLTVSEVGERFGLSPREATRRLQRLERTSGRRILLSRGVGRAKRYLVDPAALSGALEGPERADTGASFDELVTEIAKTIQAMDERHTAMSVDLRETKKRVKLLEEQLSGFVARSRR